VQMVPHVCLVKGSVWVRLFPQMFGPLACCCTGAAYLLLWIADLFNEFCLVRGLLLVSAKHVVVSCVVAVTG
jgi:hypothetical protein